jgi:hypothetical protein
MSPPVPHRHHHPVDMSHEGLIDGLRKLGKSPGDIVKLLHPSASSSYRNIRIEFPGLEFWIDDFDLPVRRHLRSELPSALHKYEHARHRYELDVKRQLTKFRHFRSAQAILAEIGSGHHSVCISPFRPDDDDDQNAGATPVNPEDAAPLGMTLLDKRGRPVISHHKIVTGTSKGSDVRVEYTPSMWQGRLGPASEADEVLLHELIHASRQVHGVSRRRKVNHGYDNEEEFLSIMIDNIYLSEKNKHRLRGTHHTDDEGKHDTLHHPERFLDNAQHLKLQPYLIIELLRARQPRLYAALADIESGPGPGRARFNPIREWDKKRRKVLIDL